MLRPYRSKIPQYLVGSRDVREEDPVAQPVERHPQRGEALSGGAVNGGDAEVLGEPVLRGEPKALSTQLVVVGQIGPRSEEHTSELQSQSNLVCRLLLEKKKKQTTTGGQTDSPIPSTTTG